MCGRFVMHSSEEELLEEFGVETIHHEVSASYNIAPSQDVAVVLQGRGERHLGYLRWGLIPSWTKDLKKARRPINARSETVHSKPTFRSPFKRRRCLIPANGFYEWQKTGQGKIPTFLYMPERPLFAMAGLWDRWESPEGELISSCTILTTEANERIAPIHNRMPVIVNPDDFDLWLDSSVSGVEALEHLFVPLPSKEFASYAVSTRVNKPLHNDPSCMERTDDDLPKLR